MTDDNDRMIRGWLGAVLAAAVLAAGCAGEDAVSSGPQPGDQGYVNPDGTIRLITVDERDAAPPLHGPSLDGGTLDVRDFPGRVVVVNFWASWCPPCRSEQPRLNETYASTQDDGVAFVGINIRDQEAAAQAFREDYDVAYPSIVDENGALVLGFDGQVPGSPPTTVVIDKSGRVAARIIGEAPAGVLEPMVEQLVAETVA